MSAGPRDDVTVLGPQRRPTVTPLPPGTVAATITAGWRAREPDDAELDRLLGGGTVNLRLYERWLDVLDQDRELAERRGQPPRRCSMSCRSCTRCRSSGRDQAMDAIRRTATRPRTRTARWPTPRRRCGCSTSGISTGSSAIRADFDAAWRPAERDGSPGTAAEVRAELDRAGVLVIAGGHVGVLLHVLRLFAVTPPADVLAWSAGAMALTDRVVLFTDGRAEAYAPGARPGPGHRAAAARPPPAAGGRPGPARRAGPPVRAGPLRGARRRRHPGRGAPTRSSARTAGCRYGVTASTRPGWRSTGSRNAARSTRRPSTASCSGTRCRSSRAGAARSCSAARPTRSGYGTGSPACPTRCRCAGCAAPTCGRWCWSCPRARGSSTSWRSAAASTYERINDPLNPHRSHSPVGSSSVVFATGYVDPEWASPTRRPGRASWSS